MDWTEAAGGLLGGLGLFLLGMWLLSDGLKLAAGGALRSILESWTRTHARGLFAGALLTAAVQSSSAVTVAIIGFVNSGLITLGQAMWVIFGSNVGTSMTGWLVAIVGLKFKIAAIALPLVGFGMLLRLTGSRTRRGAIGMALVGFGVFFLGVELLQETFSGLATDGAVDFAALESQGLLGVVALVLVGALLTAATQSSSAAIALVLTAAQGGLLQLDSAAAVVIGANVGTTSTAAISVVGATPGAKRVAASHVLFNVGTGAVALAILPLLLSVVEFLRSAADLDASPAMVLALFHTVFNVLGVLLMWPLAGRVRRFLEGRFQTEEEGLSRLRYLDDTVLEIPEVAVAALARELSRVGELSVDAARASLAGDPDSVTRVETRVAAVKALRDGIGGVLGRMQRFRWTEETAACLPDALGALQYHSTLAELALDLAARTSAVGDSRSSALNERIAAFDASVDTLLVASRPDADAGEDELEERLDRVDAEYRDLKRRLLEAGADGVEAVVVASDRLQRANLMRRACRQAVKGAVALGRLPHPEPASDEAVTPPPDEVEADAPGTDASGT